MSAWYFLFALGLNIVSAGPKFNKGGLRTVSGTQNNSFVMEWYGGMRGPLEIQSEIIVTYSDKFPDVVASSGLTDTKPREKSLSKDPEGFSIESCLNRWTRTCWKLTRICESGGVHWRGGQTWVNRMPPRLGKFPVHNLISFGTACIPERQPLRSPC